MIKNDDWYQRQSYLYSLFNTRLHMCMILAKNIFITVLDRRKVQSAFMILFKNVN